MDILSKVAEIGWEYFLEAAPWLLFGLAAAGALAMFFDGISLDDKLGKRGVRPVVLSALFGIPLPICSCGVLPTALAFRRKGLSKGGTASFLISTPETGIDSIALSYVLLGPLMALVRPVAALISALTAGLWIDAKPDESEQRAVGGETSGCCNGGCGGAPIEGGSNKNWKARIKKSVATAADILADIGHWLLLGFAVAALIKAFLPPDWATALSQHRFLTMLVMVAAGLPIYICASSSTPVAAAMIAAGVSPGAALVFLLVGPATNIGSILALRRTLGARAIARYLISIIVVSLAAGWLTDAIFFNQIVRSVSANGGHAHAMGSAVEIASAAALLALMAAVYASKARQKFQAGFSPA